MANGNINIGASRVNEKYIVTEPFIEDLRQQMQAMDWHTSRTGAVDVQVKDCLELNRRALAVINYLIPRED